MRVLGISGSLRRASHNRSLLRAAAEVLPPGAELNLWDGLAEVPIYNEDLEEGDPPAAVAALREAIAGADAVLISTPEYNHSLPGGLKNALDWASRPAGESVLKGKPVAVMGTSTGLFGAVWSQAETRKVLAATGAQVIDQELPIGQAASAFDADGRLLDADQTQALRDLVEALVREVSSPLESEVGAGA